MAAGGHLNRDVVRVHGKMIMSIYDQREQPAYRSDFRAYHNRNFDKWCSNEHDDLILYLIERYQWNWYWEVSDAIASITPKSVMDALRQQHAWHNKVMRYSITRAEALGLTQSIRRPQRKKCPLCGQYFSEDSLPHPLVKRLGIERLDFCAPCLKETVLPRSGSNNTEKGKICEFLKQLTSILERIPPQGFGEGMDDLIDLDRDTRLELLRLFKQKPSLKRVKAVFGSWLKALIEAGILLDGTRETTRGTQCVALDGHVCLSFGEKTIDDYLYKRGIPHQRNQNIPRVILERTSWLEMFSLNISA